MKRTWPAVALLVLVLAGCGDEAGSNDAQPRASASPSDATSGATPSAAAEPPSPPTEDDAAGDDAVEHVGRPAAVPAFKAHFTHPLYEDVSDEMTPFGSDAGADLLYDVSRRRSELGDDATVADVLRLAGLGGDPSTYVAAGSIDDAQFVQAAGFTLLRLTGQIDPAGRRHALGALEVLVAEFGADPLLVRQRADLRSWEQ